MKQTPAEKRAYRAVMNDKILNSENRDFKKFFALDHKAYVNGALPAKMKELMGLSVSMAMRCQDCIFYHIDRALEEGATREELLETMNIALLVGGSIVIPYLRYGFEAMEDLLEERNISQSDDADNAQPK